MIELEDCGREVHLMADWPTHRPFDATIIMVIKAPRGTLTLFHNEPIHWIGSRPSSFPYQERQCEAIKAFMEEHKDA